MAQSPEQELFDVFTRMDELIVQTNKILKQNVQQQQQLIDLLGGLPVQPDISIQEPGQIGDVSPTQQQQRVRLEELQENRPPAITEPNAKVLSFPSGSPGTEIRALLDNGDNIINFEKGQIERPTSSNLGMQGGIKEDEALWSLIMWTDNDITVQISKEGAGQLSPLIVDQGTFLKIDSFPFDRITVTPLSGFQARIYGVAGNFPSIPINRLPVTTTQHRSGTGVSTTNSFATLKQFYLSSFKTKGIRVENTHGSNDADILFQSRVNDSLNWHTDYELSDQGSADEAQLAAGDSFRFTWDNEFARFYRVRARSTTNGQSATIDWEGGGVA